MKKLLFLVPGDSSYKYPIGHAFEKLGWQIKYFDYRKGDMPIRVYRFLPFLGGFNKAALAVKKRIIKINNQFQPDIILTAKGELLDGQLLLKLKTSTNLLINLFPDYLNHWPLIKEVSKYYDFFFTFDKSTITKLEKIGRKNIRYLPQATEIEKDINYKKNCDVSFIGTYRPWREKYLLYLKEFDFHLWGDVRWQNTSLKPFYKGPRVPLYKMKEIIKRSKINLNIYFEGTPMEGVSLRPYEITGSGGFLLSQYVKDYDNVFVNNKEMVYFKSPREMREKVRYYLNHKIEREKIARAGYKRTIKDHTYATRVKQLLSIIYQDHQKDFSGNINFTGEYCIPGLTQKRIADDHIQRYQFAGNFVKDKTVLDIACGVGYGSKLLARMGAKKVEGVDLTAKIIKYAKLNYHHPNCQFRVGDITKIKLNKKFDVIVCFETIEHVYDDYKAIKNLYNHLKKGGQLLISSPNRPVTSPSAKNLTDKPNNKFHVREYTIDELKKLLKKAGFKIKEVWGQRYRVYFKSELLNNFTNIFTNPDQRSSPKLSQQKNLTPRYFVIICSK